MKAKPITIHLDTGPFELTENNCILYLYGHKTRVFPNGTIRVEARYDDERNHLYIFEETTGEGRYYIFGHPYLYKMLLINNHAVSFKHELDSAEQMMFERWRETWAITEEDIPDIVNSDDHDIWRELGE